LSLSAYVPKMDDTRQEVSLGHYFCLFVYICAYVIGREANIDENNKPMFCLVREHISLIDIR
jgi:hypothetical protein